jgi:hypothetical protein
MLPKKGKVLPKGSHGNGAGVNFNQNIAAALRAELGSTHRAVKIVMGWTGASERAVKNWLAGTHGPSGGHFVALVRNSAEVWKALMMMSGRDSVLVAVSVVEVRRKLVETIEFIDKHITR